MNIRLASEQVGHPAAPASENCPASGTREGQRVGAFTAQRKKSVREKGHTPADDGSATFRIEASITTHELAATASKQQREVYSQAGVGRGRSPTDTARFWQPSDEPRSEAVGEVASFRPPGNSNGGGDLRRAADCRPHRVCRQPNGTRLESAADLSGNATVDDRVFGQGGLLGVTDVGRGSVAFLSGSARPRAGRMKRDSIAACWPSRCVKGPARAPCAVEAGNQHDRSDRSRSQPQSTS